MAASRPTWPCLPLNQAQAFIHMIPHFKVASGLFLIPHHTGPFQFVQWGNAMGVTDVPNVTPPPPHTHRMVSCWRHYHVTESVDTLRTNVRLYVHFPNNVRVGLLCVYVIQLTKETNKKLTKHSGLCCREFLECSTLHWQGYLPNLIVMDSSHGQTDTQTNKHERTGFDLTQE